MNLVHSFLTQILSGEIRMNPDHVGLYVNENKLNSLPADFNKCKFFNINLYTFYAK